MLTFEFHLLSLLLLINTSPSPFPSNIMVLSVSAFPEPSQPDSKLINRLFGTNKDDISQPRRPLPSPSSSPTPVRATITYKRSRTSSQGFGSGSLSFLFFFFRVFMFFSLINADDEYSHTHFMGFKACRS